MNHFKDNLNIRNSAFASSYNSCRFFDRNRAPENIIAKNNRKKNNYCPKYGPKVHNEIQLSSLFWFKKKIPFRVKNGIVYINWGDSTGGGDVFFNTPSRAVRTVVRRLSATGFHS